MGANYRALVFRHFKLKNQIRTPVKLIRMLFHIYTEISPIVFNESHSQESPVQDSKMVDLTLL